MAEMVKAAILKKSGDDVPIHRRAAAERTTYDAAARRLAALTMLDEKKATVSRESRGDCGICGKEVIAEIGGDKTKGHKRLRYNREEGRGQVHFHMECVADLCNQRERALSSKGICGICRHIVSEKEDRVKVDFVKPELLYVHPLCAKNLAFQVMGVEGKG